MIHRHESNAVLQLRSAPQPNRGTDPKVARSGTGASEAP